MNEMKAELILWLVKGARGKDERGQEVGPLYIWLVYKDQQNSHPDQRPYLSANHFPVSAGRKCYLVT